MRSAGYHPHMDESAPDTLAALGWSPRWEALFAPYAEEGLVPARVIRADRGSVLLTTAEATLRAELATRLLKETVAAVDLPTAGDWVALRIPPGHDAGIVEAVIDRSSAFTRGDPSVQGGGQVLAANIDTVFVVHPIEDGANLRRIERELALAWESGAIPVVVLTKADLAEDPEQVQLDVEGVSPGVDVILASPPTGLGLDEIASRAHEGATIALIGPSGAGKSTLINALVGEERQETQGVREGDSKGRHTTVARELILLPTGGVLVDTPGLRAVAVHELGEGLDAAFPEIAALSEQCRFGDCSHTDEPGCAVVAAIESGEMDAGRLGSYHKLQREAVVAAMKTDAHLRAEEVRKWKMVYKSLKHHPKYQNRG